jgi:hypothetical protein
MLNVNTIEKAVKTLAPRRDILKVDLFGSYANETATEKSDVDIIVAFEKTPTVFAVMGFKAELEEMLNCSVDIIRSPLPENSPIIFRKVVTVYERT